MRLAMIALVGLLAGAPLVHANEPQTASGDGTLARFRQNAWWLPSYASLTAKLNELPDKTWEFALDRSHPEESGRMRLIREDLGGLLLLSSYKQPAIDPETEEPVLERLLIDVVMRIRDRDLDGIPDEFRGKPFHLFSGEQVLSNGFIKIRDHANHAAILLQWDTVVGLATKTLVAVDE